MRNGSLWAVRAGATMICTCACPLRFGADLASRRSPSPRLSTASSRPPSRSRSTARTDRGRSGPSRSTANGSDHAQLLAPARVIAGIYRVVRGGRLSQGTGPQRSQRQAGRVGLSDVHRRQGPAQLHRGRLLHRRRPRAAQSEDRDRPDRHSHLLGPIGR